VVVVALELDDTADACLRTGFELASTLGASMAVVHAHQPDLVAPVLFSDGVVLPVDVKQLEEELRATVAKRIEDAGIPPVSVARVEVRSGPPAREIVDFARKTSARFIVMGTHGRRFLGRAFLGSIADKVIRTSPVPVVAVPRQAKERGIRCGDLMREMSAIGTNATVAQAARLMRDLGIGFLPVCDADRRVVGVVTDRDLVVRALTSESPGDIPIGAVMSATHLVVCRPDEDVRVAEERMAEAHVSRVVVVDEGHRLCGVMSRAA
jgi:nucleotide-binding universal stress UspA family protein/predicted transcriptional regulator